MRRLSIVLLTLLIVVGGLSGPRSGTALASQHPQQVPDAQKCKKGYKRVNGKCKKQPIPAKTLTLAGVQVAGFTAVDGQGNVYSDSGTSSLVKFSPKGKVLARWDGLHFYEDLPDTGGGIALDGQGNVYVADTDANRIVKLSADFQVLAQWGSYGVAPGQFVAPQGIALDTQGNLYVADLGNARIQKLAPDGSVLAVWDKPGDFRQPIGITVDQHNDVYVADPGYDQIVKLSSSGDRLAVWTNPGGSSIASAVPLDLVVDQNGNVYVADVAQNRIDVLSPSGNELDYWGSDPLQLYTFVGLAIDPKGTIYASECPPASTNASLCRTVKLSAKGKALTIWKSGAGPIVPGTKVDIGGYGLHLRCTGQGSPTVVLESDYGSDSSEWSYIQPQVAVHTRVCSYDRAGLGHSDARPANVEGSGLQIAKELHTLLQKANVPGPYVLGGHLMGGAFIRLFAYTYRPEVAGMVLIDSSHEDQCARLNDTVCGAGGELPDFRTTFQQLRTATGGVVKGSLGDLPLVVLTLNLHPNWRPCDADCTSFLQIWGDLQRDLATASSNSVHVMAQRSDLGIPFEQPALVIEAIRQVVDAALSPSHALPPCGQAFDQVAGQCVR